MSTSGQSAQESGRLKIEQVFVPQNIDIKPVGPMYADTPVADDPDMTRAAEGTAQSAGSFLPFPLASFVTGRTVSLTFLAVGLFLIVIVLLRLPYPSAETAGSVGAPEQLPLSSLPANSQVAPGRSADDDLIDAITSRAVSKLRSGPAVQPTASE